MAEPQEDKYFNKGYEPQVFEHNSPGKQENDFHIENDENQGDHIKADIELHPTGSFSGFTTLVGVQFHLAAVFGTN